MISSKRLLASLALSLPLMLASAASQATLVGHWTFQGDDPLQDKTYSFGQVELLGNASVANGKLTLTGDGSTPTGWARVNDYMGATIRSKTMVVWASLTGLSSSASAGSLMTIDKKFSDVFDGIVFGEQSADRWMAGSNNWQRTDPGSLGYTETGINQLVQLAFTYEQVDSSNVRISGYRNGVGIGSYLAFGNPSWSMSNTEIIFGARHTVNGSSPGGLNAVLSEARLYDTALSQAEIQALQMEADVPEPASLTILGLGLAALAGVRRKSRVVGSADRAFNQG